jgi:UDP:flavonoid glycosyltransferase YjiC (YdhE family)
MRVLMTTTGHAGHVLPLVPFARALLRAGHDVVLAGPRSRAAGVERTGLPFRPLDDPPEDQSWAVYESTLDLSHDEANVRVIGEIFGRLDTRASLPGVLELVKTWRPDAIVREGYEFAAVLAAERHGIPHVRVGTGLAGMEEWVLRLTAGVLDELRAELGLPADPGAASSRSSPYLTRTPLALEDPSSPGPPETYRFRHAPGAPSPLPDWWPRRGGPLVYLSFGSVAGALPFFPGLYRAAIDALADLEARVLVTVGHDRDPAELDPLPPNVHVERWVPQDQVMPHAAAAVGHGGYGSTIAALTAGVPQAVVPLFADQPYNARRVHELGAGVALPAFPSIRAAMEDGPGALAGLGAAVRRVLDDGSYRRTAERVAAATGTLPDVSEAAAVLEAIAARGDATARAAA